MKVFKQSSTVGKFQEEKAAGLKDLVDRLEERVRIRDMFEGMPADNQIDEAPSVHNLFGQTCLEKVTEHGKS